MPVPYGFFLSHSKFGCHRHFAEERQGETDAEMSRYLTAINYVGPEEFYSATKILLELTFTEEEILTSTISGKKGPKTSAPSPKVIFDVQTIGRVEKAVRTQCPSITHKIFNEKVISVARTLRQKKERSSLEDGPKLTYMYNFHIWCSGAHYYTTATS